ncbi:hypothetical protein [Deinococcus ficus]|uniref:Uncharacterized protein n=1 Tax=Deinococcus ficus TaxID=317577 RepID=A0A221T2Y0_9DEIO|nr:hypothetical protein [Deinococcus ficus]ASN83221.1 hypothetical protein DFI_18665 [Deinococcus ficus]
MQPFVHYLNLDTSRMSPFTTQDQQDLLSDINHPKVLAQLSRFPLHQLELRSNLGGDAGRHDVSTVNGQRRSTVWINTAPRVVTTLDITHKHAVTSREYYAIVLLHEIGHVLAHTMKDAPQRDVFLRQLQDKKGVTDYAVGRTVAQGETKYAPTLAEYVAETFTAAVHPRLTGLHKYDPDGVQAMQAIIASW